MRITLETMAPGIDSFLWTNADKPLRRTSRVETGCGGDTTMVIHDSAMDDGGSNYWHDVAVQIRQSGKVEVYASRWIDCVKRVVAQFDSLHATKVAGRARGFTLIEMAVAVFIIALLLGSILIPLTTQVEQRQISDAEKMVADARDAIIGFAVLNGYLPCPDKTTTVPGMNDGVEDLAGSNCAVSSGNLPNVTLGLPNASDPWGNRLRYAVQPASPFTSRAGNFTLASTSTLRICAQAACTSILTNSLTAGDEAVFVVLSHGRNGFGAVSADNGTFNPAPVSPDEIANTGAGPFVSRVKSTAVATEFDDIVTWIGRPTLMRFMIAAGKLP